MDLLNGGLAVPAMPMVAGGGNGNGNNGDFFGGNGILGLIALLAIFRNGMFGNNGECNNPGQATAALEVLSAQLGNVRSDIGDVKYDSLKGQMDTMMNLSREISSGKMDNMQALFTQTTAFENSLKTVTSQISGLGTDILKMGYENQINNLNQTIDLNNKFCSLQNAIDQCCCQTNQNIQKTAFETQYRDLENKAATDAKLHDLEQGQSAILAKIEEARLLEENRRLHDKIDSMRENESKRYLADTINSSTNRAISASVGHWGADRAFNGETYPDPPYTWSWMS